MKEADKTEIHRGEWFLPTHKDIRIPGILKLNTETFSASLTLYSEVNFAGEKIGHEVAKKISTEEIILGQVEGLNSAITLYSTSPASLTPIGGKMNEIVYEPRLVLIGKHFDNSNEIRLHHFSFEYTYLGEWIDALHWFIKEDWDKNDLIIKCWQAPPTSVKIYSDLELKIVRSFIRKGDFGKEIGISIRHLAAFNSDVPKTMQEFYTLSEKLQLFLLFAVGYPSQLSGRHLSKLDDVDIEIYRISNRKTPEKAWIHPNEMFLTPRYFKESELLSYLYNWFQFYDDFQAAYDTFHNAVRPFWGKEDLIMTNITFTNGVLNILQSIETFFRRDKSIDHKKIAADYKAATGDEFGLKGKVLFYLNHLQTALDSFISLANFDKFAKDLKDCRNDLTHINHTNSGEVHKNYKLSPLFYRAQILFVAMTLHRIGVEQGKINDAFNRYRKFNYYRDKP